MLSALEILLSACQPDGDVPPASGSWSGMIPTILESGSQESDGNVDLTELDELLLFCTIDTANDDRRPVLAHDDFLAMSI